MHRRARRYQFFGTTGYGATVTRPVLYSYGAAATHRGLTVSDRGVSALVLRCRLHFVPTVSIDWAVM